jgi:hypothetical protein
MEQPLYYPSIVDPLIDNVVGDKFAGRMAHITLYSDVLTESLLRSLYTRGPDNDSLLSEVAVNLPEGSKSLLPSLASEMGIVFRYDAAYADSDRAFEFRPQGTHGAVKIKLSNKNLEVNTRKRFAILSDGVFVVNGLNVLRIIQSIGGCALLQSLLKYSDFEVGGKGTGAANTVNSVKGGAWRFTSYYISEVINLFSDALRRSPTFQEDFYLSDGYPILNAFLRKIDPDLLDIKVVSSVIACVTASQIIRGKADRGLFCSGVLDLLMDASLWGSLSDEVLSYFCAELGSFIKSEGVFFRELLDIEGLTVFINALSTRDRGEVPNEDVDAKPNKFLIESVASVIGAIKVVILSRGPNAIKPNQVQSIVRSMAVVPSFEIRAQLIFMLMEILNVNRAAFHEGLLQNNNVDILLQLLYLYTVENVSGSNRCDEIFIYRIVRGLMSFMDCSVEGNVWEKSHVTWLLGNIIASFKAAPKLLTSRVMLLMVAAAVGEYPQYTATSGLSRETLAAAYSLDGSQSVKYPSVFLAIWMLLPYTSTEVTDQVMMQCSLLLKSDEDQQDIIIVTEGWQSALLPVATLVQGNGNDVARDLLTLLLSKQMNEPNGYKTWIIVVTCCLKMTNYSTIASLDILRVVADCVIARISRERLALSKQLTANLGYLINFVEICLFNDTGLKEGLEGVDDNAANSNSSGTAFFTALKCYSKGASSLLLRVLDFYDYIISLSALNLEIVPKLFRILVCSFANLDNVTSAERCVDLLMTHVRHASTNPGPLTKYLVPFILWGIENALEYITDDTVAAAWMTLYINITATLPESQRKLFGSGDFSKPGALMMEFKRRTMFLMENQIEAARVFALNRVETFKTLFSQPIVSPVSRCELETLVNLTSESASLTARPPMSVSADDDDVEEILPVEVFSRVSDHEMRKVADLEQEKSSACDNALVALNNNIKGLTVTEYRDPKDDADSSGLKSETSWMLLEQDDLSRMRRILKRVIKKRNHLSHAEAGTIYRKADEERKKKLAIKIENLISIADISKEAAKASENLEGKKEDEEALSGSQASFYKEKEGEKEGLKDPSDREPNEAAEDETDAVGKIDGAAVTSSAAAAESTIMNTPCRMHVKAGAIAGTLKITNKSIYFTPDPIEAGDQTKKTSTEIMLEEELSSLRVNYKYQVACVSGIYLRRYRLQDTALELFFNQGVIHQNVFYNFDLETRNKVVNILSAISPRTAVRQYPNMSLNSFLWASGYTEAWLERKISNFDYLMALNTLSGRTYNDISQYPVFPWVLKDYTSSSMDLHNPAVYRDLSKPIGALNPERLEVFQERYETLDDPNTPKFLYGSHYSTAVGCVLFFLIRLEPYASLHCAYQDGHFDVTDRLFQSIPGCWNHSYTSLSEVKELIPEFFYLPEMFKNVNKLNFGTTQDGRRIDDVELPPWASSPEDFVRINREALESEYVSAHLHEWIDLIFGYKQRGPAAVAANNVFYYLTYFGAVDLAKVEDQGLREAILLQIDQFGQTPMQVLTAPHPARRPLSRVPRPLRMAVSRLQSSMQFSPDLPPPASWLNKHVRVIACTGHNRVKDLEAAEQIFSKKGDSEPWVPRTGTSFNGPWSIVFDFGYEVQLTKLRLQSGNLESAISTFAFQVWINPDLDLIHEDASWATVATGNGRKMADVQQFGGFCHVSRIWRLQIQKCFGEAGTPPSLKFIDFFGLEESKVPAEVWAPAVAKTTTDKKVIAIRVLPTAVLTVDEGGGVDVFLWAVGSKPELKKKETTAAVGGSLPSRTDSASPPPPNPPGVKSEPTPSSPAPSLAPLVPLASPCIKFKDVTPCTLHREDHTSDANPTIPDTNPMTILPFGKPIIFCSNPRSRHLEARLVDIDKAGQIVGAATVEADYDVTYITACSDFLLTGSSTGAVFIWQLLGQDNRFQSAAIYNRPLTILRGLTDCVVAADICKSTNMAIMSDDVNDVLVQSLSNDWAPYFIKNTKSALHTLLTPFNIVLCRSLEDGSEEGTARPPSSPSLVKDRSVPQIIQVFTVNSNLIASVDAPCYINVMKISKDSKSIFAGGEDGNLYIYSIPHLHKVCVVNCGYPVYSLSLNDAEEVIAVGCDSGRVLLIALPNCRYDFHNTNVMSTVTRKALNLLEQQGRLRINQAKDAGQAALTLTGESIGVLSSGLKKFTGLFGSR